LVQVLDKAVVRPALEKHEDLMVTKLVERQTKKAKDLPLRGFADRWGTKTIRDSPEVVAMGWMPIKC
jgi:hypothetical protein